MSDPADLLAAVDAVIGTLRRQEIVYFITGSFASSIHGEFRATNDLDIVAELESSHLGPLFEELSHEFVADVDQAASALASGSGFNLIHRTTYLKVDIFPCASAFDREAARRAETIAVPGGTESLRVASKEDILLAKIRWFRLGGETSETQRRDIENLIALNRGEFQEEYLRRWARWLHVDDLLSRFLG